MAGILLMGLVHILYSIAFSVKNTFQLSWPLLFILVFYLMHNGYYALHFIDSLFVTYYQTLESIYTKLLSLLFERVVISKQFLPVFYLHQVNAFYC
jgi:hypothetical protein